MLNGLKCVFYVLSFAVLASVCSPVYAQDMSSDVRKAEVYMNGLKTAKARFVQTAHDGMQLVGTFYLNRPGRLRFEYDQPIDDFIVADGYFIYFYDSELGEQMNMPIGQSLADFILRKDIRFDGDVRVKSTQRGGGLLQLELVQADDPEAGALTLAFTQDPFALKKWRVTDAQGMVTEVELFYLEAGLPLDKTLFRFLDPTHGQGGAYNE